MKEESTKILSLSGPSTFSSSNFWSTSVPLFQFRLFLIPSSTPPSFSLSFSAHRLPFPRVFFLSLRRRNVGVDVGEVSLQGRRASTDPSRTRLVNRADPRGSSPASDGYVPADPILWREITADSITRCSDRKRPRTSRGIC